MEEYSVKIKCLTSIWTGDANGKNSTLRETGIIGSLRWWYEALIRGLGGSACDPTDTKCDGKNHCDACELFGCTGWARKFKLEVEHNTIVPEVWIGTRKKRENRYLKRNVAGFMSDETIILTFVQVREISKNEWQLLNATFNIIENYGAIGAHISQGNGVIKIVENNLPHIDEINQKFKNNDLIDNNLPNLKDFFFYKYQINFSKEVSKLIDEKVFWTHQDDHQNFQDNWENWKKLWDGYHFLPIAFHIRDSLRPLVSEKTKRHNIFGELGNGSKVFVSHGYKIDENTVEVRIFGYDIDSIKNTIKDKLQENLKKKLFSNGNDYLDSCTLSEEKTGGQLLEGLK